MLTEHKHCEINSGKNVVTRYRVVVVDTVPELRVRGICWGEGGWSSSTKLFYFLRTSTILEGERTADVFKRLIIFR